MKKANDIRKHALQFHQTDLQFAHFLGNLSELIYNKSKDPEAGSISTVKEGRMIYWYKLRDFGVEIKKYTFETWEKSKVPKEVLSDASGLASGGVPDKNAKGGKAPAGKDAKGGKGGAAQQVVAQPIDLKASAEEPKTHP
jgi:hypothetical protein